jgi:ADP-ribose pyrophosphatase YjhB (NUDIX family)
MRDILIPSPMKEKKFTPRPGQVDFTNIRYAPVINCVLKYNDKILLVQRNKNMRLYPGYWNGISGFLDDHKSIEQKVYEELREEVGLTKKQVISIQMGTILEQEAPKYKKTWIVHPILVKVNTDKIRLDWEAQNHTWITLKEAQKLNLMPGFDETLKVVGKLK